MLQSVLACPPRPLLVLVSGAPACGKSTLAPRLAQRLALPLMARDNISEELTAVFDPREQRSAVLTVTFRVFYRLMADMLRTGEGLVAESNFHRGAAENDLHPFLTMAQMVRVCFTSVDTARLLAIGAWRPGPASLLLSPRICPRMQSRSAGKSDGSFRCWRSDCAMRPTRRSSTGTIARRTCCLGRRMMRRVSPCSIGRESVRATGSTT